MSEDNTYTRYIKKELQALMPLDMYGVSVQLVSSEGKTKFLKLEVELAKLILELAKKIEDKK